MFVMCCISAVHLNVLGMPELFLDNESAQVGVNSFHHKQCLKSVWNYTGCCQMLRFPFMWISGVVNVSCISGLLCKKLFRWTGYCYGINSHWMNDTFWFFPHNVTGIDTLGIFSVTIQNRVQTHPFIKKTNKHTFKMLFTWIKWTKQIWLPESVCSGRSGSLFCFYSTQILCDGRFQRRPNLL